MKVLLDTNVILDLMLERDPWRTEAEAIADADANGRLQSHVCLVDHRHLLHQP
jgi:predicted nucleic acid-binding protein